jgi:hypothetical protein
VEDAFQERRRTPRVATHGRYEFRLGRRIRIRVVDISGRGALLAADERLPIGTRGRIQVSLGGHQFDGTVEVRREHTAAAGPTHLVGSTLTPSQSRHQDALEQFLRRAGN